MESQVQETEVVETLTKIYREFAGGEGISKIDVSSVLSQMLALTAKYGNIIQIPPYFAYIARAFLVLEGIGLRVDPEYSIVENCLPYISQRLLTDKTAGKALEKFLFGASLNDRNRVIDADRLELLVDGRRKFESAKRNIASIGNSGDPPCPVFDFYPHPHSFLSQSYIFVSRYPFPSYDELYLSVPS